LPFLFALNTMSQRPDVINIDYRPLISEMDLILAYCNDGDGN